MTSSRQQPLRIGLTGGIASGKSAVADLFARHGVTVIDTDVIAREVVEPGTPGLQEVRTAFGDEVIDPDGALNRATLRAKVFADPASRVRLEGILHPLIRAATLEQSAQQADANYQIIVVPLLAESGFRELVDRVLVVDCPVDIQRARLMARDNETVERADEMIRSQLSREERLECADDVITNDGTLQKLLPAVENLHQKYTELSATNIR